MAQLIIFDLDGTLIDSRSAILSSIRHALHQCELNHLVVDEWKAVQQDLATSLREAAQRIGELLSEDQIRSFVRAYRSHHAHEPERSMNAYEGVFESLALLKQSHSLAVATTKHSEQAEHILKSLRLDHFFDHIQGTDPGLRYKPAPDILHRTLELLEARSEGSIYVGDSPHDIEAAHAAGMGAVGATYGFAGFEALQQAKPHAWVHSPKDLLNLRL